MLVQKYRISIPSEGKSCNLIGCLIYRDNQSDQIIGFISDYHGIDQMATITLFEPNDLPITELEKVEVLSQVADPDELEDDILKGISPEASPLREFLSKTLPKIHSLKNRFSPVVTASKEKTK